MSDAVPVTDSVELTEGVTGRVEIAWLEGRAAKVSADALTYQGRTYKVDAYYRKTPDGWWSLDSERQATIGPPVSLVGGRSRFRRPIRSERFAAVVVAMSVALDSAWTPERAKAVAIAAADRAVEESSRKLRELYKQVAEAEEAHADLLSRYAESFLT